MGILIWVLASLWSVCECLYISSSSHSKGQECRDRGWVVSCGQTTLRCDIPFSLFLNLDFVRQTFHFCVGTSAEPHLLCGDEIKMSTCGGGIIIIYSFKGNCFWNIFAKNFFFSGSLFRRVNDMPLFMDLWIYSTLNSLWRSFWIEIEWMA